MQLGDRMKAYEKAVAPKLEARKPVIVRVDGKCFHTFTRNLTKPFDQHLIEAMDVAALTTLQAIQGAKLAYVQSDEISFLLTDWDSDSTEPWFGNKQQKLASVAASYITAGFNWIASQPGNTVLQRAQDLAIFDARAFNVPDKAEAANYFLWRILDWKRNFVSSVAMTQFSATELHGKSTPERIDMLTTKLGDGWQNTYPPQMRYGRMLVNTGPAVDFYQSEDPATFANLIALIEALAPDFTPEETPIDEIA